MVGGQPQRSLTKVYAVVELGLKTLARIKRQERIKRYKGKLKWEAILSR